MPAIRRAFSPLDDPIYNASQLAAQTQRDVSQAALLAGRKQTLSDYGFSEGSYDPAASSYGTLTFDPSNPFSKAALLKRNYDTSRIASGRGMAAAGNLYAGSYQSAQDLINRGQVQSEDALNKSLQRFLAQNTQRFGQTGVDYLNAVSAAAGDAAARFAANPPS